jgi:ectoine hydroxylase-related dioxygenase (phytanoyl-CoA dioxygenase family)
MEDGRRQQFESDGFFIVPTLLSGCLLAKVLPRIDAVYRGEYQTGVAPGRNLPPSTDPPASLVKIDNAHRSDPVILEVVSSPEVGKWAAEITGAAMVQVFATQLLIKPPGKDPAVNVGWHQDQEYWDAALEGELLTAWIAISDVPASSGPMRFVQGSHRWGLLKAGDFFSGDLDFIRKRIEDAKGGGEWNETAAVLSPGGVSFHHRLTVHGSGPNVSPHPRVSFAVHLRTEKSSLRRGTRWQDAGYLSDFDDPVGSPVIYRAP